MYALAASPVFFFAIRLLTAGPEYLPESRLFRAASGTCGQRVCRPIRSLWAHSMRPLLLMVAVNIFFNLGDAAPGKFLLARLGSTGCGFGAAHVSILTAVSGAIAVPCLVLSGWVNDRCGRVPTGTAIWVGTSLAYGLFYSTQCDSWLLGPSFALVVIVAQFIRAAVTQTLQQEVWRTEHRATTGIILSPVSSVSSSAGFMLYPLLRDPPERAWRVGPWTLHGWGLGSERALAVLSQLMLLSAVAWVCLPETGGKRLQAVGEDQAAEDLSEAEGAAAPLLPKPVPSAA